MNRILYQIIQKVWYTFKRKTYTNNTDKNFQMKTSKWAYNQMNTYIVTLDLRLSCYYFLFMLTRKNIWALRKKDEVKCINFQN